MSEQREWADDHMDDPFVKAWFDEHLPKLRRSASGNRMLYRFLALGVVVGLAAHIGGYLLKRSDLSEPFALIGDLLYALGYALWTGVVVALFVQVIPEVKRRQIAQALEAYDEARRKDEHSEAPGAVPDRDR
jgi:hypothetical protein